MVVYVYSSVDTLSYYSNSSFNFIIDPFKIWVIVIIYIATYFTVFLYDFTKMKPEEKPYD